MDSTETNSWVASCYEKINKWKVENDRRLLKEVKELGFNSLEEYHEDFMAKAERNAKLYSQKIDKLCDELQIDQEQYYAQHPQRFIPDEWSVHCNCNGMRVSLGFAIEGLISSEHPIPFFCPESLVDVRSMDSSDDFERLRQNKRVNLNDIKIREGEKSRRLDQSALEKRWLSDSQETSFHVPFWARKDPEVQQLLSSRSSSPVPCISLVPFADGQTGSSFCRQLSSRSQSPSIPLQSQRPNLSPPTEASGLTCPQRSTEKVIPSLSGFASVKKGKLHQGHGRTRRKRVNARADTANSQRPNKRSSIDRTKERSSARNRLPVSRRPPKMQPYNNRLRARLLEIPRGPSSGTRSHAATKFFELAQDGTLVELSILG